MNIKEYISSGIVESYVLGLAPEPERLEFEQLCRQYPELVAARTAFEEQLEKQAFKYAVSPVPQIRDRVLASLDEQEREESTAKIITMDTKPGNYNLVKWVAAAAILLMLGAAYFAYNFYNERNRMEAEWSKMHDRLNLMAGSLDSTRQVLKDIAGMGGPNVTLVSMKAMKPAAPEATVFWDSTSANVYLVVKNMSRLPNDKQYQLWSLLDGKPTSLGLFDGDKENLILRINNAQKADAFAISIEKRGNTDGPTMEEIQTMGETRKKL